jgi:predicted nucleic acid-binding protein
MKIIADANVLFSFFRRDSLTREIIINSNLDYEVELIVPDYVFFELKNHKKEICKKANISEEDFYFALEALKLFIYVEEWKDLEKEAASLLKDNPKDIPYVALALKFGCPIWSYDAGLKKQAKIKILTTKDLLLKIKK